MSEIERWRYRMYIYCGALVLFWTANLFIGGNPSSLTTFLAEFYVIYWLVLTFSLAIFAPFACFLLIYNIFMSIIKKEIRYVFMTFPDHILPILIMYYFAQTYPMRM
jgi:hypothetical protein